MIDLAPRQNYSSFVKFLVIALFMIIPTLTPLRAYAKPIEFIGAQQTNAPTTNAGQTSAYRFDSGALIFVPRLVQEALDASDLSLICTFVGRAAVETVQIGTRIYAGAYDIWDECSHTDSLFGVLSFAQPGDDTFLIIISAELKNMADVESLAAVLSQTLDQTVTIPLDGLEPITAEVNEQINRIIATGEIPPRANEAIMTLATVLAATVDVHSGPSANFERIGFADQNMTIEVIGQINNCQWLRVRNSNADLGWISGNGELVTLNKSCRMIPESQR